MKVTEIATGAETCTAIIHQEIESGGDAYSGPIAIGFYTACDELWIECEGQRVNLPLIHLKDVLKQIKRAEKISNETVKP